MKQRTEAEAAVGFLVFFVTAPIHCCHKEFIHAGDPFR